MERVEQRTHPTGDASREAKQLAGVDRAGEPIERANDEDGAAVPRRYFLVRIFERDEDASGRFADGAAMCGGG